MNSMGTPLVGRRTDAEIAANKNRASADGEKRTASRPATINDNKVMAKKTIDWMKKVLGAMLAQFDGFTLKLPSYQALFGLTAGQVTGARNDYLWASYAVTIAAQFEQEAKNRFEWRDNLLNGPVTQAAAQVPSVGSEFVQPQPAPVPDGILTRWRALAEQIRNHPAYTKAIGEDLGIEAPEAPAQATKPRIRTCKEDGGKVILNVLMDGHDAVTLFCRRGNETQPTPVGVFTRAKIEDVRPVLVPGQPELREYSAEYRDNDQPVGQVSDVCTMTKQP